MGPGARRGDSREFSVREGGALVEMAGTGNVRLLKAAVKALTLDAEELTEADEVDEVEAEEDAEEDDKSGRNVGGESKVPEGVGGEGVGSGRGNGGLAAAAVGEGAGEGEAETETEEEEGGEGVGRGGGGPLAIELNEVSGGKGGKTIGFAGSEDEEEEGEMRGPGVALMEARMEREAEGEEEALAPGGKGRGLPEARGERGRRWKGEEGGRGRVGEGAADAMVRSEGEGDRGVPGSRLRHFRQEVSNSSVS